MKNLIKLIVIIVVTSIVSSCSSTKSLAKEGILLIEGSDLYYEVQAGDEKWNFDLNINHFGNSISFDYDLGDASGTISIDEKALKESTNLYNYFGNGYKRLTEKTTVWVSKKMFKDLKSGKPVAIGLGNSDSEKELFTLTGKETYSFGNKEDGVPYNIPVLIVATKDAKKEIWIADDSNNRLIVMMKLDFRIDLVNYKEYDGY
ncbi:MAG: hypothetical protein AB8B65_07850 [Kordia sp.]|uniref:hypothetical protein n=1 Tax=Kordia sp. TaxID=1965332 RepID=UPI00385FC402